MDERPAADQGRRSAEPPRRPADGPPLPIDPRVANPGGVPGHPAEATGRRHVDAPRPTEQHTGQRPRPNVPVDGPAAEGTGRRPYPAGPGPRPEHVDGPRHPGEEAPPGAIGRRLADGSGPRRLADGSTPDAPGRRLPDGSGPRRFSDGPAPDGTGRRPRPELPADGPRRLADGPAPDAPRRLADAPEGTGRRPRPEIPADGPHRPGPDATGRRPVDGPRPEAPGLPGEDGPNGRRLPDGSGPRPRPEDLNGPRRLADGPAPDGSGPRRPVDGPAPDGPRRLAEGPAPDGTGRRPRPEVPATPNAPRRLADGPAPDGPPRPPGDAPGRRFAEDPAEPQPPAAPIADRLGTGNTSTGNTSTGGPEPRDQIDPMSLTTEMEAISDDVKKRREVDHTLARFSAVHDELAEQERLRKERLQKLLPWKSDQDEDATEYASPVDDPDDGRPRRRVRSAKHSRIVKAVKAVALTAASLVFVSTGVGWGAMLYIDSKIVEIEAIGSNSAAVHEAEKQLGDENFLIVGSDTRAGARPEDGVGDAATEKGARSDVLMLAHIPADRKRMVIVSVPRDVQVERPECEQWDPSTGQYTGVKLDRESDVKANEPYAVGGPQCVVKFMTELTGLEINHFISVDFNGFKGMVDAVGAVTVCSRKPMIDEELGVIFDKAGKYDINGDKALDYVRARKVGGELFGDFDRIARQQQFLSALLRKALSSEILLNPGKLNAFLNAFAAATVGDNIGVNDMLTLAQSLRTLEAGRVSFVTVPHTTQEGPTLDTGDNIEVLDLPGTKRLFQTIIDGTPLPNEAPAPEDPAKTSTAPAPKQGAVIDPKGLKIQVRNGDPDADGAAGTASDELTALGFEVVISGNGTPSDKTIIKYHVGGEDIATTLQAAVPGATLVPTPSMGGAVELLIGSDWDGVIRAPQAGGQQAQPGQATPPPADVEVVNAAQDPCAG
ncbi:LCP family protein [Saccharothrix syringae]|uniref:LytR family transcriptional regulator n=1 Tax=Saccharothrix syringae TaxID=103733 RepID=A0A5Q0HBM3_SACSY|nr:LCP family protein [Saccharothrix syringae]QFZ23658.1 hypothetical protein EKG83_45050 [Saccharothrix syringae]